MADAERKESLLDVLITRDCKVTDDALKARVRILQIAPKAFLILMYPTKWSLFYCRHVEGALAAAAVLCQVFWAAAPEEFFSRNAPIFEKAYRHASQWDKLPCNPIAGLDWQGERLPF